MRRYAALLIAVLPHLSACDSEPDDAVESRGGSAGTEAGSGGTADQAGNAEAGAPGAGGSAGSGGVKGSAGSGGSLVAGAGGTSAGSSGSSGASGSSGSSGSGPPDPTDDGLSIYTVACEGDSAVCNYPSAHCLGIYLAEGGIGYACSNQCQTASDCSDAPSGAEAEAGCVEFSNASRCVLVCHDSGVDSKCPEGMQCYQYPGSPIGYCLWI